MTNEDIEYSLARFNEEKRDLEKQLDNLPRAPLDNLLELYHSVDLHLPKCPPERYQHGIDLLNSITCYNDIASLHYACAQCAKIDIEPLISLLDNGVDVNICNERGNTAFQCFAIYERRNNRINDVIRNFFKHVFKLKAAGLHVHPQNQRQYEYVLSRDDMRHFVDYQLKVDYEHELNQMSKSPLDEGSSLTLRDVLREEIDLTSSMSMLKKTIENRSLTVRFPRLACLLKMRYKQIVLREQWKPLVVDALRMLTRRKLPRNCVDMVVASLMNYDLANLLSVAFNMCLQSFRNARSKDNNSARRLSMYGSPRRMMPRIY